MRKSLTLIAQYSFVGLVLVLKPEYAKAVGWVHLGIVGLLVILIVIVGLAALDEVKK